MTECFLRTIILNIGGIKYEIKLERENKILKNMKREYKKEIERLNRSLNGVIKAGRTLTLEELDTIYNNCDADSFEPIKEDEEYALSK